MGDRNLSSFIIDLCISSSISLSSQQPCLDVSNLRVPYDSAKLAGKTASYLGKKNLQERSSSFFVDLYFSRKLPHELFQVRSSSTAHLLIFKMK